MNIPSELVGTAVHTRYVAMVARGWAEDDATWGKAAAELRAEAKQSKRPPMSAARRYDNLHNEGGEGFNPYR